MMNDRGYKVGKNMLEKTYEEFKDEYGIGVSRSELDAQFEHYDDERKIIKIIFSCEYMLQVSTIRII